MRFSQPISSSWFTDNAHLIWLSHSTTFRQLLFMHGRVDEPDSCNSTRSRWQENGNYKFRNVLYVLDRWYTRTQPEICLQSCPKGRIILIVKELEVMNVKEQRDELKGKPSLR